MELRISGLHPVTGDWVILQKVQTDAALTPDEISQTTAKYADLIKELMKQEPSAGVQMNLSQPGRRVVFDPRKFLAVDVSIG